MKYTKLFVMERRVKYDYDMRYSALYIMNWFIRWSYQDVLLVYQDVLAEFPELREEDGPDGPDGPDDPSNSGMWYQPPPDY